MSGTAGAEPWDREWAALEDPEANEELWQQSLRRYNTRRRKEIRAAWRSHHEGHAARLRATLESLIATHEEQAERYRDQAEGAEE